MPGRSARRPVLGLVLLLAAGTAACSSPWPPPPDTRVETVHDTLHGVVFADHYRWLEDQDAPETRAWIAAQNAHAEVVVGDSPVRAAFEARLRELLDREEVGSTREVGKWEFFTMRREGEEMERIYRRPAQADETEEEPTPGGAYDVFLDPADFDSGYRVIVSLGAASPDERSLMYTLRQGGSDEIEVRIRDLESGEDLPDRLPPALYGDFDWDDDSRGFTYVHRDRYDGPRIRRHLLGTPVEDDPVLWGEGYGPEVFIGRNETPDGRWILYSAQHGWARNDWFIQDARSGGPVRPIVVGIPAHFQVRYRDGRLWILTDWEAPNYRLLTADPADPAPERWEVLIPQGDHLLQSYTPIGDRIYATYLRDVADRILVFQADGTPAGEIEAPDHSTIRVSGGEEEGTLEITASGYLRPSRSWTLDPSTGERTLTDSAEVPFDTTGMAVRQVWYTSADGTRAPMYVLHREGIPLDGSHPTILSGYGGFNVAIKPGFSATQAAWVEMGGVWAVATLRGGNEYGEEWHRAGMLENKPNVFADFIAAAEQLVAEGYATPQRLGISGGSNGGLLVASAMTLRPDLFRAVLCTYPDLDMIRFWAFQDANNMPALLEYGDARIREHFEAMRRYSPYQAVTDGVDYPAVMLTTGDLDTRVPPLQARKMTARLQAASASGLPVVLWYDEMGGHAAGRGRPMSLQLRDGARELAFMAQQLGLSHPEVPGEEEPQPAR